MTQFSGHFLVQPKARFSFPLTLNIFTPSTNPHQRHLTNIFINSQNSFHRIQKSNFNELQVNPTPTFNIEKMKRIKKIKSLFTVIENFHTIFAQHMNDICANPPCSDNFHIKSKRTPIEREQEHEEAAL
jgi:hypothetical protein